MQLTEPIEISPEVLNALKEVKTKMLLNSRSSTLMMVTAFTYEEKVETSEKKNLWGKVKITTRNVTLLTSIDFWAYSPDNFWGTLQEDGISTVLYFYDLLKMRRTFKQRFKEPLKQLGYEIKKIVP